MRARIGERDVGGAGAGELGVELDVASHVGDNEEGRPALGGGEGARVLLGLAVGAEHGVAPDLAAEGLAGLLGFENEAAALIEVDEAAAVGAVGVMEDDLAFKDVGVVFGLPGGGLGTGQVEEFAKFR